MLGYYAHNHGSGHAQYARLFAESIDLVILTSATGLSADLRVVDLPDDFPDATMLDQSKFPPPRSLHYAPLGMRKSADRYRIFLEAVAHHAIDFLVVDVSVEVATFARLCGIPTAYVRLMGDRTDPPHLAAFESAAFLLAYFPEALESPETPDWIRRKTLYLGFFSRFQPAEPASPNPDPTLVVIHGQGSGDHPSPIDFANLRRSFPDHVIFTLGSTAAPSGIADCHHLGHVPEPRAILEAADLVVGSCGLGTTSELATLGKKFIAVPDLRPFDEQAHLAAALAAHDLCLRATTSEPDLADRVARLQPDWAPYVHPDAPARFAKWFALHAGDVESMGDDVLARRALP